MPSDPPRVRRVLWVCDYFPRPHDMTTGTWALESAVALQAAGLPVVVLAPTPWIPRVLAWSKFLRAWSRLPPKAELKGVPVYYPRVPHYPRRWVIERLYHRVPWAEGPMLWPWCQAAADRIMREYPFDVVHANFLFPAGALGVRIKRRYGTPLVVQERSVQRLAAARRHRARGRAYRRILRAADAVLTENRRMAQELRVLEPGLGPVAVVKQPGTHPEAVERLRRPRPAALDGRPVVLSVGALSERKGHAVLVRAVAAIRAEFPGLLCRIVGEGPERPALVALIRELGLEEAVELCGRLPHDDVLGAMSWCDVFALPSWGEAGGTVYGEAMQFGIPVIACMGEGIAELVRDGVHGLLVPSRDVEALASALRRLLADPEARRRMGARAAELAATELAYPGLARTLIDLYRRVTA